MANIVFHIPLEEGKEKVYILEFNRRTIVAMEDEGVLEKLQDKKVGLETIDVLVKYACLKNQPNITDDEVQEIVDSIPLDKLKDFVEAMASMLKKAVESLQSGNAHWETK